MESKCLQFDLHLLPHISLFKNKTRLRLSSSSKNPIFNPPLLKLQSMRFTQLNTARSESLLEFHNEHISDAQNDDLRPTSVHQRTFSCWEMASLWIGLVVGVPSYYLAGSLVDLGMSWWQGISTVILANLILLVPLILTGHPGTKYGIPFPVLARSSFGINGAHIPSLLRALVGCGWFGIETWIGGEAIFLLLPSYLKNSSLSHQLPWLGTSPLEFSCFAVFWLAQLAVILKGIDGIRKLEKFGAPILSLLTLTLLCWAYVKGGGFGKIFLLSNSRLNSSQFWSLFFPSLTANIGFWATVALNIPDFTRYAKSQRDQILGQIGLPVFMGLFTFVGLAVSLSTESIFGRVVSNPIELLGLIGGPSVILSIIGISLATITTNIAANVVAPANALVNLCPTIFTFRKGAFITAILGVLCQPWRLLQSSESFVYTWLIGYSALLGPIGGIILVDYYLVHERVLNIKELYSHSPHGVYFYFNGYNLAALTSLLIGILPILPGFLQKLGILTEISETFTFMYNNSWFITFFLASAVYWFLSCPWKTKKIEFSSSNLQIPPLEEQ